MSETDASRGKFRVGLKQCHTERGYFIPGCIGGAIYGTKNYCTCHSLRDEMRLARIAFDEVLRELVALESILVRGGVLPPEPKREPIVITIKRRITDRLARGGE